MAENRYSDLSNSTLSEYSENKSLELENVFTEFVEAIDPSSTSKKENDRMSLQPTLLDNINTSSMNSDKSNLHYNVDDLTMHEFNEILQLKDPVLSDVKQPGQKVTESVGKVFQDITSSSTANNFRDEIPLMPPTEFQNSEETAIKPMPKMRMRTDNETISTHQELEFPFPIYKDKVDVISLANFTSFEDSKGDSLPIMKPIFKPRDNSAAEDNRRKPKERIPFNGRFTKMRRYKHTYFDSDGNAVEFSE